MTAGPPSTSTHTERSLLSTHTTSAAEQGRFFSRPGLVSGAVPLGRYDDGTLALWRLYSDCSMWGGTIVHFPGDGGGNEVHKIALCAMYSEVTYVVYVDGQDGASAPALWRAAGERYASDEVDDALDRLTAMLSYRTLRSGAAGDAGFIPWSGWPGILVMVSAGERVITDANAHRWNTLALAGRKIGIAPVITVERDALETFRSSTLRAVLRTGNAIGFSPAGILDPRVCEVPLREPNVWRDRDAPGHPSRAVSYRSAAVPACYTSDWIPSRAAVGRREEHANPLLTDVRTRDDWFADAPRTPLDAGTAAVAHASAP
jgi:hypothetical protein